MNWVLKVNNHSLQAGENFRKLIGFSPDKIARIFKNLKNRDGLLIVCKSTSYTVSLMNLVIPVNAGIHSPLFIMQLIFEQVRY